MKIGKYSLVLCLLTIFAALLSTSGSDVPYGYRSLGTDTYASGEPVRDGECYSFVWVRNGCIFSGYNRDGSLVDPANNIQVYVRALALNGQCPPVNFLVSEAFAATHADGSYQVLVLDTRRADGQPAGLGASGELLRVNGWGEAALRRETGAMQLMSVRPATGGVSDRAALMPADCRQPVITGLSIGATGDAVVEFANSESYLSYRLVAGETPANVGATVGQEKRDGSGSGERVRLTLKRDEVKGASATFMRVEAVTDL